jgi:hypothetical protein
MSKVKHIALFLLYCVYSFVYYVVLKPLQPVFEEIRFNWDLAGDDVATQEARQSDL